MSRGDPVIDVETRLQRLSRAARLATPGADFLMARAAEDLADRLAAIDRRFAAPVVLFSRTAHAVDALMRSGRVAGEPLRIEQAGFAETRNGVVAQDPEALDLPAESADLIVSLLALHAVNDVAGFFVRVLRALKPDGLFIAALPGAGTLRELREALLSAEAASGVASPRIMPFADIRQLGDLLQQAGFAMPVVDVDEVVVRYASLDPLMRDLRAMGETNALVDRSRKPAPRTLFAGAERRYAAMHGGADGRLPATFSTIWLSGWAPHPDRPKPARRGSAAVSLAQALNNAERGLS